jgi:adenylate kinase family enzyme
VAWPSVLQSLIGGTLLGVRRIAVVGSGGAGKSTCARRLGALTGIPVIHLDRYFWQPGWVETPSEQWRALQADLGAGESWIMDGNYGGTFDVRFARADTVLVLAMPRWLCLTRALWRTLRNRGRDVQAEGCPERVDLAFLRWIWRYPVVDRTASRPLSIGTSTFESTSSDRRPRSVRSSVGSVGSRPSLKDLKAIRQRQVTRSAE